MKKIQYILLLTILLGALSLQAQPPSAPGFSKTLLLPAYIDEITVRDTGIREWAAVNFLASSAKIAKRSYADGLGRPFQEVAFGVGTSSKPDLVSFYVYDNYGREVKKYLPFAINTYRQYIDSAAFKQNAFYTAGGTAKYVRDDSAYARSVFDNSPLNRILQQGSEGVAWQLSTGKVVGTVYRANTSIDSVRQLNSDATSIIYWPAGKLNVSQVTDEEGHKVLLFTDKSDRIILQRGWVDETIQGGYKKYKDIYYVYHSSGLPLMILPPNVSDRMRTGSWTLSSNDLNNNIYRYEYDSRGRVIRKKTPSAGWINMVYDKLDRLCLVQTASQQSSNKWYFLKYDKQGRKILEGILQDNTHTTASSMQTYADTYDYFNTSVTAFESRGGSVMGYTDACFPQSSAGFASYDAHSAYYYDSYDTDNNGSANYSYQTQSLGSDEPVVSSPQGHLTVASSKKLGTSTWITKVYFYDVNGQLVQEQSNNVTNSSMNDIHTNVFGFIGQLKKSINKKTIGSTQHTVQETMAYDGACRVDSVIHQYNTNTAVTIAKYIYNELGQLVDKKLGRLGTNSYLQSVDLRYNIRGWLTGINNIGFTNDGYNDDTDDLFGMEFLYETSGDIGNTGLYNGQVSGVRWKMKMSSHPYDNIGRAYTYSYDKLGQLRNALYKGNNGSGWTYQNGAFDEKNISYDLNGNILALERKTLSGGSAAPLDNLSYVYKSGATDQLQTVTDANGGGGSYGFKNQSVDAEHYLYDADGRVTQDKNRNVTYTYNAIGKVDRITLLSYTNRYIQYSYTGAGECLSKEIVDNGSTVSTTGYAGIFIAENNVLSYVNTAEGRVRTASGVGTYEYFIKDHLGNVRVSFENVSGVAVVRQENSYYAFGLVHNATIVPSGPNKQLYNDGSLWENDFGNDPDLFSTPLRQYDPVLGRFNGVDANAEEYDDFSPYHYSYNNPIGFNDPTGADPYDPYYNPYSSMGYERYDESGSSFNYWLRDQYANAGMMDLYRQLYTYIPVTITRPLKNNSVNYEYEEEGTMAPVVVTGKPKTVIIWVLNPLALEGGPGPKRSIFYDKFDRWNAAYSSMTPQEKADFNKYVGIPIAIDGLTFGISKFLKIPKALKLLKWWGAKPSRIQASSLKDFKTLVNQLSKPGSQLTQEELRQLEKLAEKFGGSLRYDLNPVKGKILEPHVQVEGLGSSVESRHIWLAPRVK